MAEATPRSSISQLFPLRRSSEDTLVSVCQGLWGWTDCGSCQNRGNCSELVNCSWNLRASVEPYLQYYLDATSTYNSDDWDQPYPALQSHADLRRLFELIIRYPERSKSALIAQHFAGHNNYLTLTEASKNHAFDLALSVLTMIPCSRRNPFHVQFPDLSPPENWRTRQSAQAVLQDAVKTGRVLSRHEARSVACKLSASKLHSSGISIIASDDLRQHLLYDPIPARKRVYIFRHAGFLKACLTTREYHASTSPLLSRQLASNTLYTLRFILYKYNDASSCAMAEQHRIDLSCLGLDRWDYTDGDDDDIDERYSYWGERLLKLAQAVDEPDEDSRAWAWIKRRSGKEYIMLLTLLGVIVTFVGVVVGPWMQSQETGKTVVLIGDASHASMNAG